MSLQLAERLSLLRDSHILTHSLIYSMFQARESFSIDPMVIDLKVKGFKGVGHTLTQAVH